jgi:hypothetical protein
MAWYGAVKRSHAWAQSGRQTGSEGRRSSPDDWTNDRGYHPSQIGVSMPCLLRSILLSITIIGIHMVGTLVNACPSIS